MNNYKDMTFDEIVEDVRSELGLNDYHPSSVYAKHNTLELFIIKCADEYYTWYHCYCIHSSTHEPVCFRAVTSAKDANRIFKALTT